MIRLSYATQWIGAVTMSALLLWLPWVPVISQQQAGSGHVRSQMLQHLSNTLAQLTAAGGDILDIEGAAFGSLADVTLAYIPFTKDAPALAVVV